MRMVFILLTHTYTMCGLKHHLLFKDKSCSQHATQRTLGWSDANGWCGRSGRSDAGRAGRAAEGIASLEGTHSTMAYNGLF